MAIDLRNAVERLSKRERDFVVTYARFAAEHPDARDEDLAEHLGVTRRTVVNRRRRLWAKGVPLARFAPPGGVKGGPMDQRPCCPTCGRMHPKPKKRYPPAALALEAAGVTMFTDAAVME